MVAETAEKSHPLWMKRLETPAYRVTDAARYAGLRPAAISEWFRRSGPSLPHRDRGLPLSYLELIEVAFVATFKSLNVPMRDIRRVRDCLARVLESEYPFSARDFKSKGLPSILRESSGQLNAVDLRRIVVFEHRKYVAWNSIVKSRFSQFDYDYGMVVRWHLVGRRSRVAIDPRIAFGDPMVSGLATWVIKGRCEAGYSADEISAEYQIDEADVRDALDFERCHSTRTPGVP